MRRFATLTTIALTSLALLAGCETVEPADSDVLDMDQLALTVDSSTDGIDADADLSTDAIEDEEDAAITDPDPSADRLATLINTGVGDLALARDGQGNILAVWGTTSSSEREIWASWLE